MAHWKTRAAVWTCTLAVAASGAASVGGVFWGTAAGLSLLGLVGQVCREARART